MPCKLVSNYTSGEKQTYNMFFNRQSAFLQVPTVPLF